MDRMELEEVLKDIRTARFCEGVRCPRCGHGRCIRWGRGRGRQRYRCEGCRRTFNDLTGTPAAYTKKILAWPIYTRCMDACVPVRSAATRCGVHPCTAFRWRHRQLSALRARDAEMLRGWIELISAWLPYSEKGKRGLSEPRRRPLREPWPDARHGVNVLIAGDRGGHIFTHVHGRAHARMLTYAELEAGLDERIAGPVAILAEEGPYGVTSRFSIRRNLLYRDARPRRSRRDVDLIGLERVRAYRTRLFKWLPRFRGVATKYLTNYLAWHRSIDRPIRQGIPVQLLSWPLSTGFG